MKRLAILCGLTCAAVLLAGCPDAKPPKDPPMIPTPKAGPAAAPAVAR